jgi:hypothetical protein
MSDDHGFAGLFPPAALLIFCSELERSFATNGAA